MLSDQLDQPEIILQLSRQRPAGFDKHSVELDDVEWAISSLVAEGIYPSLRAITQVLAGVSQKLIEPLVRRAFNERKSGFAPAPPRPKPSVLEKMYELVASELRDEVLKGLAAEIERAERSTADAILAGRKVEEEKAEVDRRREAISAATRELRAEFQEIDAERTSLLDQVSRLTGALNRADRDIEQLRSKLAESEDSVGALTDLISRRDRSLSEKETLLAVAHRDLANVKAVAEAEARASAELNSRLAESQERAEAARNAAQELANSRNSLLAENKHIRNERDRANAKLSRARATGARTARQLKHQLAEAKRYAAIVATNRTREAALERRLAQVETANAGLLARIEEKAKEYTAGQAANAALEKQHRRLLARLSRQARKSV